MLTKEERLLIKSLHSAKGREESGLCLVEGQHAIDVAGSYIESTFTEKDTLDFGKLVTLKAEKGIAGLARIPKFTAESIQERDMILVLDGLQDPGNVGTIFRLAFAFDASIILIGGADPVSPKVIRSSTGTMFRVPWQRVQSASQLDHEALHTRSIFRLEKTQNAIPIDKKVNEDQPLALIIGSEGNGIQSTIEGTPIYIPHNDSLDSLNVATATAIALYELSRA